MVETEGTAASRPSLLFLVAPVSSRGQRQGTRHVPPSRAALVRIRKVAGASGELLVRSAGPGRRQVSGCIGCNLDSSQSSRMRAAWCATAVPGSMLSKACGAPEKTCRSVGTPAAMSRRA